MCPVRYSARLRSVMSTTVTSTLSNRADGGGNVRVKRTVNRSPFRSWAMVSASSEARPSAIPTSTLTNASRVSRRKSVFAEARSSSLLPADLLEQELLSRCPAARVRALAGAEDVRPLTLRVERHHNPGLDKAALRQLARQRMRRVRSELDRTAGRPQGAKHLSRLRVDRHLVAHAEETGEFRTRPLHLDLVRDGLGVTGMHQPRAIAVEDRQRSVEDVAHHLLEVIRCLDGAVHPIQTLDEPSTVVLRPHALRDVDHHAAQPAGTVTLLHHGHQVSQPRLCRLRRSCGTRNRRRASRHSPFRGIAPPTALASW